MAIDRFIKLVIYHTHVIRSFLVKISDNTLKLASMSYNIYIFSVYQEMSQSLYAPGQLCYFLFWLIIYTFKQSVI